MEKTYEDWIASELLKHGMTKAICPHCGNDDQNLMKENLNFTHAHHKALNYQCHNYEQCGNYFQIGPLSECLCGWNKEEDDIQSKQGKNWNYAYLDWI